MSEFKQQYKNPRLGFGQTDHSRILRACKHVESRREVRTRAFDNNRKLQDVSAPTSPHTTEDINDIRMKKLIKWREERLKKKKLDESKKKPAFKVGIVHHSLCSPVIRSNVSITVPKTRNLSKQPKQATHSSNVQDGITKVTQKRIDDRERAKKLAQKNATKKNASTSTKYSINIKKSTSNTKKQKSFAPANYEFKPPSGLPLFGLVPIEPTPQEKGDFFIRAKSTECRNEQENTSSQKLYAADTSGSTAKFKVSASPKLLPIKRKSLQRLNESSCNQNNVTSKLNKTTISSASKEEAIQDSFSDESLSDNVQIDMQTPSSKKSTPSDTFSGKENCTEDLIQFSPYLTLSRGKKNARKEQQQKLGIGRLASDEIPTKDTVMKNLNISVEEEERTAQYFKFLLNKETKRLNELCKKWLDIKEEKDIPDDAVYEIYQAVGQTNLLINKKFERFRGLVEDCEKAIKEKLVTCRDLQGFWDMTYMEVRDCDSRFEKLEQRRNREWQEEECTVAKPAVKPAAKKRMPTKKQIVSSKPSSLRSLIVAARKKKMEAERNLMQDTNINMEYLTPSKNRKSVNFDNTDTQYNTRRSKSLTHECKSTPVRRESSRTSLVQKVQFSSDKKIKSPFVTMKVSQMGKTPEVQLDDTILYINSDQTPGKSILKKSEDLVDKEIRIKSIHKVNFNDQIVLNEVPIDEETQTKLNLSAALSRIDSLDLDELSPEECLNAEKKLNFETDEFDTFDDMNEISTEIQKLNENPSKLDVQNTFDSNACSFNDTTFSISDKESSPSDEKSTSSRKKIKYQNQHKNAADIVVNILPATPLPTIENSITSDTISNITDMENDLGTRILRNRTITTNNTPKNDRTSKMMTPRRSVSKKENNTPVKSSRKSLSKLPQKDQNEYDTTINESNITEMENMILTEIVDKKRRSSRKSVAFSGECLACVENKPVLPMTPHLKRSRSKTPSRQSRSKHALNEDLISWGTPTHPPNRVTRSHSKN